MFEDMAHPGSFAHSLQEPAGFANRTAMFVEGRNELGNALIEAGNLIGRPFFELADINGEAERRHASPDVRAAVHRVVTKLDHPVTPGFDSNLLARAPGRSIRRGICRFGYQRSGLHIEEV